MIATLTFAAGVAEWHDDLTWHGVRADELNSLTQSLREYHGVALNSLTRSRREDHGGTVYGWPQPFIWQRLHELLGDDIRGGEFLWQFPDTPDDVVY